MYPTSRLIFGYAFCTQVCIEIHVYKILTIVAENQPSIFEDLYWRFSDLGIKTYPKTIFRLPKWPYLYPNFLDVEIFMEPPEGIEDVMELDRKKECIIKFRSSLWKLCMEIADVTEALHAISANQTRNQHRNRHEGTSTHKREPVQKRETHTGSETRPGTKPDNNNV